MSQSQIAHVSVRALLAAAALFIGTTVAGEMPPAANPDEPSKEMRGKMAAAHDAMAACLRSDKSFVICRNEMMATCKEMHGEAGCPMMGMGMHQRMKKQ